MRMLVLARLGVVCAIAASSGCAQPEGRAAAGAQDPAALFDGLITRIYGSAEDRRVADMLMNQRIQSAIAACMGDLGRDYEPAPYQGIAGGPVIPADVTFAAPLRSDLGLAREKQQVAMASELLSNPGFDRLETVEAQEGYADDLSLCSRAGAAYEESYHAESQEPVASALEELLLAAEGAPEVRRQMNSYADCLAKRGVQASTYLDVVDAARDRFPATDASWQVLQTLPAWEEATSFERKVAAADAACRTGLREYGLGQSMDALREFEDEYASELMQLDKEWQAIRREVQAAGLSG